MTTILGPVAISVAQACDRWGVGKTKLYDLINADNIRAVKIGSRTLIDVRTGDDYFASLPALGRASTKGRTDRP